MLKYEENSNKVFLIDYGLAKQFSVNGKHIEFREDKELTGTLRFCSSKANAGKEQSRRDDLESLGYTFSYLLKGRPLTKLV